LALYTNQTNERKKQAGSRRENQLEKLKISLSFVVEHKQLNRSKVNLVPMRCGRKKRNQRNISAAFQVFAIFYASQPASHLLVSLLTLHILTSSVSAKDWAQF